MVKFFFWLLLASLIIAGLIELAHFEGYLQRPTFFLKTLLFTFFITLIIFVYLYKARKTSFFIQLYLLTMVLKVIAYCAYNLIMVLKDRSSATGNVVFFLITYFIFTAIEIGFLYRKMDSSNNP